MAFELGSFLRNAQIGTLAIKEEGVSVVIIQRHWRGYAARAALSRQLLDSFSQRYIPLVTQPQAMLEAEDLRSRASQAGAPLFGRPDTSLSCKRQLLTTEWCAVESPMSVDVFIRKLTSKPVKSDSVDDQPFINVLKPMMDSIEKLAECSHKTAPKRRLAIFQSPGSVGSESTTPQKHVDQATPTGAAETSKQGTWPSQPIQATPPNVVESPSRASGATSSATPPADLTIPARESTPTEDMDRVLEEARVSATPPATPSATRVATGEAVGPAGDPNLIRTPSAAPSATGPNLDLTPASTPSATGPDLTEALEQMVQDQKRRSRSTPPGKREPEV
eukprot:gene27298-4601_t